MNSSRRVGRVVMAFVATAALVAVPTVGAQADDEPASSWWYDGFHVAQVQADGWTGAGVKVAVIDNQINPGLEVFQGAHLTVADEAICPDGEPVVSGQDVSDGASHGSDVTALLIGNGKGKGNVKGIAPKADVTFYAIGYDSSNCPGSADFDGRSATSEGIRRAVADGARIISISSADTLATAADDEEVAAALAAGVVIVAATPNSVKDAESKWPWSFNGVVSVNAFGKDGKIQEDQQVAGQPIGWKETTVVAPGANFPSVDWRSGSWSITGASLATPLTAGILAVAAQKYPDATGNQLIQSLIHNTRTEDHKLSRDGASGYGPVSLRHILQVDPATYPDVNPLMDKASGRPTAEQVAQGGVAASPTATPTPTQKTPAATPTVIASGGGGVMVPLLVGGGVILLLIVIAVIVIIVVAANRKKNNDVGGAV